MLHRTGNAEFALGRTVAGSARRSIVVGSAHFAERSLLGRPGPAKHSSSSDFEMAEDSASSSCASFEIQPRSCRSS